jgi:hypothetical protein
MLILVESSGQITVSDLVVSFAIVRASPLYQQQSTSFLVPLRGGMRAMSALIAKDSGISCYVDCHLTPSEAHDIRPT